MQNCVVVVVVVVAPKLACIQCRSNSLIMRFQFALSVICLLLVGTVEAFTPPQAKVVSATAARSAFANKKNEQDVTQIEPLRQLQTLGTGFVAAATVFASSLVADLAIAPPTANGAELELSRGAIVVQTSSKPGQQLIKTEVDSQSLIKTLFKNRKELGASAGRIQKAFQDELNAPVWREIQKELVDIEGDVLPTLKVSPPSDITTTIKDISKGKLNLLVNGEVISVTVEPSFGKEEDGLIVRIKGFKGEQLPGSIESKEVTMPSYGPIRSWLAQYDDFWAFWNEPYPSKVKLHVASIGRLFFNFRVLTLEHCLQYLLDGFEATNGQIILTGAAGAVGATYLLAYMYYVQGLEQEEAQAAAKKAAIAKKAKSKTKKEETSDLSTTDKEGEEEADTPNEVGTPNEAIGEVKKRRRRFRFWKKD